MSSRSSVRGPKSDERSSNKNRKLEKKSSSNDERLGERSLFNQRQVDKGSIQDHRNIYKSSSRNDQALAERQSFDKQKFEGRRIYDEQKPDKYRPRRKPRDKQTSLPDQMQTAYGQIPEPQGGLNEFRFSVKSSNFDDDQTSSLENTSMTNNERKELQKMVYNGPEMLHHPDTPPHGEIQSYPMDHSISEARFEDDVTEIDATKDPWCNKLKVVAKTRLALTRPGIEDQYAGATYDHKDDRRTTEEVDSVIQISVHDEDLTEGKGAKKEAKKKKKRHDHKGIGLSY